jgi:glycosyltransferase involved in cell wall biosynthesis
MKKVAFYYPVAKGQNKTGGYRTTINLITNLKDKNVEPLFLSQRQSQFTRTLTSNGVEVEVVPLPDTLDVYDKKVLDYGVYKKLRAFVDVIRYNYMIKCVLKKHNVEVIWTRGIKGVLFTGLAALRMCKPLIWDVGLELQSSGWMRIFHLIGLTLADKVVTQAKRQPREIFGTSISQMLSSKFKTVYPGIANSRRVRLRQAANSVKSDDSFVILCVGSIHPRKNQLMLLRAFKRISKHHNNIRVKIAGSVRDTDYYEKISRYARSSGIDEYVDFLGWRDDIPKLLGKSDLMVLCSYREGIPNVVREAMFAETPVIATAVGGVPEAVKNGKTGFLVNPDNTEALRTCVEHLIVNPEKRKNMGRSGLHFANNRFSKKAWLSGYKTLLDKITK